MAYFASPRAGFVTGQCLYVDGGKSLPASRARVDHAAQDTITFPIMLPRNRLTSACGASDKPSQTVSI